MTQQVPDDLQRCALFKQMSGACAAQTVRSAPPAPDACRVDS